MKPILKICLIISSVLFAAGIACIGIGIAMGVTPAQLVHAGHCPGSSLIRSGLDEITSEVLRLPELSGISEEVPDDLPDHLEETENLSGTSSSDAEEYYEFQNIQELELELSLCSLNIDRHDKDFIAVEADNVQNYFRCLQEGDTLSLKDDRPHSARQNSTKNELRLTLYLPDQIFREVSVEMEVGEIRLDALAADEVEVTNGVGSITIGTLNGADLSVHTGVGEFLADWIQADREADIKVDTGSITLAQFDGNSLEVECGIGNAEITAAGSELNYNYTLHADLGSISLNSRQQNNYGHHLDIHHGADRRISVNCSLGNATLNFMEE